MVTPIFPTPATPLAALGRLCAIARRDTGQASRVANFLLAWRNSEENGGWDPTDLWQLDTAVAQDILSVIALASERRQYPGDLGFKTEIEAVWRLWRGPTVPPE